MKHQATHALFQYWNDLRGERSAPERNDIDPGAIRHILADTFMLDIDQTHDFPFRLAGTRVNALFDADQKGRSFLNLWRAPERRNIVGILLTVADGACPVVAGALAAPPGHDDCPFEILFLPMRHHGKTHSRILGMIKTIKTPAWLGMLPIGALTLRSLRVVEAEERAVVNGSSHHGFGRSDKDFARGGFARADFGIAHADFGLARADFGFTHADLDPARGTLDLARSAAMQRPADATHPSERPHLRVIEGGASQRGRFRRFEES